MKKRIIISSLSLSVFFIALMLLLNYNTQGAVAESVTEKKETISCERFNSNGSCGCAQRSGSCNCGSTCSVNATKQSTKTACGCQGLR